MRRARRRRRRANVTAASSTPSDPPPLAPYLRRRTMRFYRYSCEPTVTSLLLRARRYVVTPASPPLRRYSYAPSAPRRGRARGVALRVARGALLRRPRNRRRAEPTRLACNRHARPPRVLQAPVLSSVPCSHHVTAVCSPPSSRVPSDHHVIAVCRPPSSRSSAARGGCPPTVSQGCGRRSTWRLISRSRQTTCRRRTRASTSSACRSTRRVSSSSNDSLRQSSLAATHLASSEE